MPFRARRPLYAAFFLVFSLVSGLLAGPSLGQEPESAAPASRPAEALIEILRDDDAREALIAELERAAAGEAAGELEAEAGADEPEISLGRRIALTSQSVIDTLADGAEKLGDQVRRLPGMLAGFDPSDIGALLTILQPLLLTILTTILVFSLLRRIARRIYGRIGDEAVHRGWMATAGLIVVSVLIDAVVVLLTWAVGYAIAVLIFGETGAVSLRQSLYLNAFLMIEMAKVVLRLVLSPSSAPLRLFNISDRAARYLAGRIGLLISIVGYGHLFLVPVIQQNLSAAEGDAAGMIVSLIAVVLALVLVIRGRKPVAAWLNRESTEAPRTGALAFLIRRWHWPVAIYLLVLAGVVITRPGGVLLPMLAASARVIVVIVAGVMIGTALGRLTAARLHLPDSVTGRLPLLERRLNGLLPRILEVFRLFVVLAVIAFVAQTLSLIDITGFLESRIGIELTGTVLGVIVILFAAFIVWLGITSWIDYRLNPEFGKVPTVREQTLLALLRNAVTIVLIVITLMFVLSEIGLDIAPLIASAGVLGLAIGFGAQKMVQDIITGIFIQFENAINVGDVVTLGGTTGTVERLTIRSVSLRDVEGVFHIIPFSSVDMVSNYMRDFSHFLCDMGIAYRENIEDARVAMMDAFEELKADPAVAADLMGELQWMGLQSFGDSAIIVRARIKTQPGKQWATGRAYNAILKRVFDERGIEIPFPHQTIYFGEDRDGKAPPLHIARAKAQET